MILMADCATVCKFENFPYQLGMVAKQLKSSPATIIEQKGVFIGCARLLDKDFVGCSNFACDKNKDLFGSHVCMMMPEGIMD